MARRPSKRVPRYREIAQILRSELAGEVYSLGGLFPKEFDLCERFNVSWFTIRNAIGTIVKAFEPAAIYVQTLKTVEGFKRCPAGPILDVSEMIELQADVELAGGFDLEEGTRTARLGGL
jgi:hypothetical protein